MNNQMEKNMEHEMETGLYRGFCWGVPKISGTLLGVPIIRIMLFWGLYWGPPIQGNFHVGLVCEDGDCRFQDPPCSLK